MGGKHAIHVGKAPANTVGYLGLTSHAAAQKDLLLRVAALGMGQGPQIAKHPLLGVFPDGTGIQNHHIRSLGFRNNGIATLGEVSPDFFGIGLILLAAVGFHEGCGCAGLLLPKGRDFVAIGKLLLKLLLGDHGGFGVHGLLLGVDHINYLSYHF